MPPNASHNEAGQNQPVGRGKGSSIFEMDIMARDDLRYRGKQLTDQIKAVEDKWRLVPAFLQTKGLIKQHIDSFNYFIETDMKQILLANAKVDSDVDPNFWLKYDYIAWHFAFSPVCSRLS